MDTFRKIEFVGWDSEGINDGWIDPWTERQKLVLIGNSTGASIYDEGGLTQARIFDFIFSQRFSPNVRHVIFGGSYDFNKFLEGLPFETVQKLHEKKGWTYHGDLALRYRPRKELVVARKTDGPFDRFKPVRKQTRDYIRFWDVIGFFQASFLTVVQEWLGKDYPEYELIAAGKLARLSFAGDDKAFMDEYNKAECRALVAVMNKLRDQMERTGLRVRRWDGAGAVAGELFRSRGLRKAFYDGKEKIQLDAKIETAARYAYFGGRIESGFMGHYANQIYSYDINSAYPFAASQLPNLNFGNWRRIGPVDNESQLLSFDQMSIFRVQWYFHNERQYYPFPFRNSDNSVIFPRIGERWIFYPELMSAIRSLRPLDQIRIWEGYEFKRGAGEVPFAVLPEIYRERQKLILQDDPAQMVLKLGMNSVYGKLCQKIGWNETTGASPVFHNLLFAGWITSYVRAMIYNVVSQAQADVISISTDGIISTKPLPIVPTSDKRLGGWTLETFDEIVQLQSGVYWLRKGKIWKERARGLGRVVGEGATEIDRYAARNEKIKLRIENVLSGWENKTDRIFFPVKLFVTSHKAMTGPEWFPRWGHWFIMHDSESKQSGRGLELRCSSWGKRRLKENPGRGRLVPTIASENIDWSGKFGIDDPRRRDLGAIYELPWIDGNAQLESESEMEIVAL